MMNNFAVMMNNFAMLLFFFPRLQSVALIAV